MSKYKYFMSKVFPGIEKHTSSVFILFSNEIATQQRPQHAIMRTKHCTRDFPAVCFGMNGAIFTSFADVYPFWNVITKPLKQVSHRYRVRTEPDFIFNQLRSTLEAPLNLVTKLWWLWISSTEFFQRSVSRKHILRREHNFLDNWISMNGSIRSTSLKLSTSKLNNKYKVKLLRTKISQFLTDSLSEHLIMFEKYYTWCYFS